MPSAQVKVCQREIDSSIPFVGDVHPILKRILQGREVYRWQVPAYRLSDIHPPDTLSGVDSAVALLAEAIFHKHHILIVGDFDADGATGTAVAIRSLRAMGHDSVSYLVPNRFEHGYGLSVPLLAELGPTQPDLIITVDNGISSINGVREARNRGIRVIITDHHLPGESLPDADAIVNPNMPGDEFPSKNLSGVGVVFYLMAALRAELRGRQWFDDRPEPNLGRYLDLVALGTVADVVTLDQNNRNLVASGLKLIRDKKCVAGISALFRVSGRDRVCAGASDLGFSIGPRLNAAGRLKDIAVGIECLLSDDEQQVMDYASQLEALNAERKQIQEQMQEDLGSILGSALEETGSSNQHPAPCLYRPDWHQGLVGLIASKVKERLYRPVIAFAPADEADGSVLKGSARSIAGLHIRDVLADVDTASPGLIERFGGHAMAAGLTLELSNLDQFQHLLDQAVTARMTDDISRQLIRTDGELAADDISLELASIIDQAGPWGQGFPVPSFEGWFTVLDKRIVGGRHLKMQLLPLGTENAAAVDAIAFFRDMTDLPEDTSRVRLIYELQVNIFRGRSTAQLMITHILS